MQEYQKVEERREEVKQQIALAAMRLLQDPEQHLRDLTALVDLARDRDELVRLIWPLSSIGFKLRVHGKLNPEP